ncbi:MAG: phosphotransferase [Ancrocorticia sp.]
MSLHTVLDYVGVEGAHQILDPQHRAALLGEGTVIERLRVKPGSSLVAAWSRPDAHGNAGWADRGWIALLTSEDKVAGILRRATRGSGNVTVHRDAMPYLLSGPIDTDPRLARPLARALREVRDEMHIDVVRYNPSRRLVLRVQGSDVPGGDAMMRIAPRGLDRLMRAEEQWAAGGAPVLRHQWWGSKGTAALAPYWGSGDLTTVRSTAAAYECGRMVARVHEAGASTQAATIGSSRVPGEAAVVAQLIPGLSERLDAVDALLGESRTDEQTVPLHGDLSPDQVLTDGAQIRLIDLDRARAGAAGEDLGSWCAACRLIGAPELETAFLEGYGAVRDRDLAPWIARALLTGALEPFRRWQPDWPGEIEARVTMAEEILGERKGHDRNTKHGAL